MNQSRSRERFLGYALTLVVALASLSTGAVGQEEDRAAELAADYVKSEHDIEMRDGVRLHTTVYRPREAGERYPFLMLRTPYSCGPYGEGEFPDRIGPSRYLEDEGFIFVCQDVRGRWMSEGRYDNMRPHVPGDGAVDESSDTWDTIEWLLAKVDGHNGRVGQWGISYPGFYTAAALPEAHPALVASSPQAPIADFFFDDFHHRGAYFLSYWLATPVFGYQKEGPTPEPWYEMVRPHTRDGYEFYMDLGPLSNADRYYGEDNFFWQQLVEHPNYDAFWQARNLLPHLTGVDHAVMTVGGWFDAEDLYGPLNIYRTLEEENAGIYNILVMGPWSHGDWARERDHQVVGEIWFGDDLSAFYQREVEAPFFRHFLKDAGEPPAFEALVFDTGRKAWLRYDDWPPPDAVTRDYHFRAGERLDEAPPTREEADFTQYLSDPDEPVPYVEEHKIVFTPRAYMTDDQRFAERRPDVVEFQTEPLAEDVTFVGPITAHLRVSTTGADADWVVKLIDVYPDDTPNGPHTPEGVVLGGYQQMVRSEVVRGRFRNSFEEPEPFVPGRVTEVELPLQDVHHTFQEGHRIMVQVQSTWFPLVDRNPQTWVENIFTATDADFAPATQRVYHAPDAASRLEVRALPR